MHEIRKGKNMEQKQSAAELTQQMVRIDSTNPGAGENGMEQFLVSFGERLKLANGRVGIRTEEVLPGRNNVMLFLPGEACKPELVFICHMDTVPAGSGWEENPFSGEIREGKLYGRGACDMKSGFACALSAFQSAAESDRGRTAQGCTLKLIGTVDEEGNMAGAEKVIQSGWVAEDSLVLDMEPTNGEVQAAHKGRLWFEIAVDGITAHAATPWKGADAIAAAAEVIGGIRREFEKLARHPQMGASTVSFGRISGGSQPYVVSEQCRVTVDMRLVPPYTRADGERIVKEAAEHARRAVPKAKVSYQVTGDRPFIEMDETSELYVRLQDACRAATGRPAETGIFPGYTDTAVIAGKLGNRNCMSYGPGDLELAHKPGEYVPVADIRRCEAVLKELVKKL